MTDNPDNAEKKILVDEDSKAQVEAEKLAAEKQAAEKPPTEEPSAENRPAAEAEPPAQQQQPGAGDEAGPMPPPSLIFLAGGVYLQGFVALGLFPGAASEKPEMNLPRAKHAIDTLQMLEDKTQGNRTPEETRELENMLHELRLAYVGLQEAAQGAK